MATEMEETILPQVKRPKSSDGRTQAIKRRMAKKQPIHPDSILLGDNEDDDLISVRKRGH